jgi:hypothetical protein
MHDGDVLPLIGGQFHATFPARPQSAFRCREGLPILGHFQGAFGRLTDHIFVHRIRRRGGARLKDDIAHADFGVPGMFDSTSFSTLRSTPGIDISPA